METDPRLPLVAFSKREDPRDCLVLPEGKTEMEPGKPIGCASLRRTIQLKRLFPDWDVQPVRGNVQTRLRKLDEGQFSALVLASAGLKRLGLEARISRCFSPEEMLPAAGQGILAVQARGVPRPGWGGLPAGRAGLCAGAGRGLYVSGGGPRCVRRRYLTLDRAERHSGEYAVF